jgi:hypothetical protein
MLALTLLAASAISAFDASAFNNASCKTFLTGAWSTTIETHLDDAKGRIVTQAHYDANGAFSALLRITPQGMATNEMHLAGTWTAAPGLSSDSCAVTVNVTGSPPVQQMLIVLDANTVRDEDGIVAHRSSAAPTN